MAPPIKHFNIKWGTSTSNLNTSPNMQEDSQFYGGALAPLFSKKSQKFSSRSMTTKLNDIIEFFENILNIIVSAN